MARVVRLLGHQDYTAVHALQRELLEARIRREIPDVILLLEHTETITLGRKRGADGNVLDAGDVPVVPIERGGDATWHGPGQLVAYPIVALEGDQADLHRYLRALEDAVIGLLADYGVPSGRDPRNTGVWIDGHKVCSIGIACRRWVTWHGLALNVTSDLRAFERIHPCGFESSVMTRLADHLSPPPSVDGLVAPLAAHLCARLGVERQGGIRLVAEPTVASVLG